MVCPLPEMVLQPLAVGWNGPHLGRKGGRRSMKIIEPPTLARHSPILLCETCGKESLLCNLHRKEGSDRLSCHCGKDSITRAEAMEPMKCQKCGQSMQWVTASDFRGWSCMGTPCCVFRISVPNAQGESRRGEAGIQGGTLSPSIPPSCSGSSD